MQENEEIKHLYRSNDAIIAGVCGGIADYFSMDRALVRVIAVILFILGIGSPILIYLVMAIVIPKAPADYSSYVDVNPVMPSSSSTQSIPLDVDGRPVGAPVPPCPIPQADQCATAPQSTAIPADEAAASTSAPFSAEEAAASKVDSSAASSATSASNQMPGAAYSASYAKATNVQYSEEKPRRWLALPSFVIGLTLIGIGLGSLLNRFFPGISWGSFWPVLVILCGIIGMCSRPKQGNGISRIVSGALIIVIGLILLGCTTRVLGWGAWNSIAALWPLLLIGLGVAAFGKAFNSTFVRLCALIILMGTLVLGVYNYHNSLNFLVSPFEQERAGIHIEQHHDWEQATIDVVQPTIDRLVLPSINFAPATTASSVDSLYLTMGDFGRWAQ